MMHVTIRLGLDNDPLDNLEWATLAGYILHDEFDWRLEDRILTVELDTTDDCVETISQILRREDSYGIKKDPRGYVTGLEIDVVETAWGDVVMDFPATEASV